jgi:hypothetical protein
MDALPRKRQLVGQCACRRFASLILQGASLFLVPGERQSSGAIAPRERFLPSEASASAAWVQDDAMLSNFSAHSRESENPVWVPAFAGTSGKAPDALFRAAGRMKAPVLFSAYM